MIVVEKNGKATFYRYIIKQHTKYITPITEMSISRVATEARRRCQSSIFEAYLSRQGCKGNGSVTYV